MKLTAGKITLELPATTPASRPAPQPDSDLHAALLGAFSRAEFDRLLRAACGRSLETLTTANGFDAQLWDVLAVAGREGWLDELVRAALDANPRNRELRNAAE